MRARCGDGDGVEVWRSQIRSLAGTLGCGAHHITAIYSHNQNQLIKSQVTDQIRMLHVRSLRLRTLSCDVVGGHSRSQRDSATRPRPYATIFDLIQDMTFS